MLLNDRISQAIALAPRHGKKVALLFLDLNGFKQINDSLGHLAGDKLLQSIAKRLQSCLRRTDTVCRHGGDEFVVLLSEVQRTDDAARLARQILDCVAEPHFIDGQSLNVSGSIGISLYPEDGADAASLLENADSAMYEVKGNGRQGYKFFGSAVKTPQASVLSIEESSRRAPPSIPA
jgi:diguanylate cyclase (GGDEF)-like protein